MDTDTGDRASTSQIEMIEVMFFKIFFPSEQQSRDCFFEGGGGIAPKLTPPHTHTQMKDPVCWPLVPQILQNIF